MPVVTKTRRPISADQQRSALKSLSAPIILGEPRTKLPPDEEIVRLLERYKELMRPANVFQRNLTMFASRLCFTSDEAAGGVIRRMPDWPYLAEIDAAILTYPRLFIEKSRRVLASWRCCIADIWVAAGGRSPQWETLMRGDGGNRVVVIAAQRLEGIGGSAWYVSDRVKVILDQFEARGLRKYWSSFPEWEYSFGQIRFSNGSSIRAVAQGADQLRGISASLLHFEELSFMDSAGPSVNAAIPVLRGGGHIVAVSSPLANTFAHRLVDGRLSENSRPRY